MQEDMLLELFSIPVGLKKVVKVDDVELYTSDSLTKRFVEALSESEVLQAFSDKISSLVDRGRVIPCYINRGIIKVFLWKFLNRWAKHNYGSSLAFYSLKTNNVYVLIDNNISYLGFVSNDHLAKLLVHELAHMATFNDTGGIRKLFSTELLTFYSNYYQELFKITGIDIDKKDIGTYIFDLMTTRIARDHKKFFAITESFLDSFKKKHNIKPEVFDKIKAKYMYVCKVVMYNERTQEFYMELVKNKEIIVPLIRSYRKSFGINITQMTFPFQEIFSPSEMVCIYCEEVAPKEKVLEMLSLIK